MKVFGVILILLGIGLGIYTFNMPTSIDYLGKVTNLSLIHKQSLFMQVTSITLIIGFLFYLFGELIDNIRKDTIEKIQDRTYTCQIYNKELISFEKLKKELIENYKEEGTFNIKTNNFSSLIVANNDEKSDSYFTATNNRLYYLITVNELEKPKFIDDL